MCLKPIQGQLRNVMNVDKGYKHKFFLFQKLLIRYLKNSFIGLLEINVAL